MSDARIHAFDHLRALAMLLGVAFHVGLAYSPLMQSFWLTADRRTWVGFDVVLWFLHLLRMPLFFLVAGFFTAWLDERRGMGGLARQRVRRILVPLVVFWPLTHVAMTRMTVLAAREVEHPSQVLSFLREWLLRDDAPMTLPSLGHLWFLYYLLLFSVLFWVGRCLDFGAVLRRWMALGAPLVAATLPFLILPGFALTSAPHPAPESYFPQLWALLVYGPFFALGVGLHGRLDFFEPLRPWLLPATFVCLGCYALFYHSLGSGQAEAPWATAALQAVIAAWGTLCCLMLGLRLLARPSSKLRFVGASAYWTYLAHLPLVFAIQYVLLDRDWPLIVKFTLTTLVTLALCFASYALLVRCTPLRRFVG